MENQQLNLEDIVWKPIRWGGEDGHLIMWEGRYRMIVITVYQNVFTGLWEWNAHYLDHNVLRGSGKGYKTCAEAQKWAAGQVVGDYWRGHGE